MKQIKTLLPALVITTLLQSCYTVNPHYNTSVEDWQLSSPAEDSPIDHSVYLIGDAGNPDEPLMQLLTKKLEADPNATVVFLGDNIYYHGLPDSSDPLYGRSAKRLVRQLDVVKNHEGNVAFIPGNHDWASWGKDGWNAVRRQEVFVNKYLGKKAYYPGDGCPGPFDIELNSDFVLILIDTQWWLHRHERPEGEGDGCLPSNEGEFLLELKEILDRYGDEQIIVAGHHPIISYGNHGGRYDLKDYFFPFTNFNDYAYIPFPLIYPVLRKFFGHPQDLTHPDYKDMNKLLLDLFSNYDNLIYAAGHEHNLQYVEKNNQHFIVSGSGSSTTYVSANSRADYTQSQHGFFRLDYYKNGELWMEAITTEEPNGKVTYRKKLKAQSERTIPKVEARINYADSTVDIKGYDVYAGGKGKRFLLGDRYREEWTADLTDIPVLDMSTEKGGLTPIKKGGGFQTLSLRLQNPEGKQFVFRTIQKNPETILPEGLRKTFVKDIGQDVISSSHPYAAFVIARMADAAGVYHTNPKLVFIPDDPLLGQYREEFANSLVLFEERPDDDMSDSPHFGNTKKVTSTPNVIEETQEDNDNIVDQHFTVRNRLFDIFLNDWDRHDDQWRWARFKVETENGKKTIYKPIPRDRDQAFFKFDGFLSWFVNRRWGVRMFQTMDGEVRDMPGLNNNGRHFDRTFLTELTLEDWLAQADTLQRLLTDEVIDEAMKDWHPTIQKYSSEDISKHLKARRDNLKKFAKRYYLYLAKEVNVVGSDKDEYFLVERIDDELTRVRMFNIKNGDELRDELLYDRTFKRSETDEVRLYGLGEEDIFEIKGEVKKGIKIRVIGGKGDDEIKDESKVRGLSRKTIVYDVEEGTKLDLGNEAIDRTSDDDITVNMYNRKAFDNDMNVPLINFGYFADDGIYIGAGINFKKEGFRKQPYAASHKVSFRVATLTGAIGFTYDGDYKGVFGSKWNANLLAELRAPDYTTNFFGLGNTTQKEFNRSFYRARYNNLTIDPSFYREIGRYQRFEVGVNYTLVRFDDEDNEGKVLDSDVINLPTADIEERAFTGLHITYKFKNVDNDILPTRGFAFTIKGSYNYRLDRQTTFSKVYSEAAAYHTIRAPFRATLGFRLGGGDIYNNFEFYQGHTLGGIKSFAGDANLRGYRRDRFTGRGMAFLNTEVRVPLFTMNNYITQGKVGLVGFYDAGRVWVDNEDSDVWHRGYGAGLWWHAYGVAIVRVTYSYGETDEDELLRVGLGFFF